MLIYPPLHTHTHIMPPTVSSSLLSHPSSLYCFLSSSPFPIPLVIYSFPPFLLPYPWYLSSPHLPIICSHLTSPSRPASTPPPPLLIAYGSPLPSLLPLCPLLFPAFASCSFLSLSFLAFFLSSGLPTCSISLSIPPSVSLSCIPAPLSSHTFPLPLPICLPSLPFPHFVGRSSWLMILLSLSPSADILPRPA